MPLCRLSPVYTLVDDKQGNYKPMNQIIGVLYITLNAFLVNGATMGEVSAPS